MYSFLKIMWAGAKMLILWLGKRLLVLNRLAQSYALGMVEFHAVHVSDVEVGVLFFLNGCVWFYMTHQN